MNWLRIAGIEESLSARRAWIEIIDDFEPSSTRRVALRKESVDRNVFLTLTVRNVPMSLSARRAWIEIPYRPGPQGRNCCRSPQGERG